MPSPKKQDRRLWRSYEGAGLTSATEARGSSDRTTGISNPKLAPHNRHSSVDGHGRSCAQEHIPLIQVGEPGSHPLSRPPPPAGRGGAVRAATGVAAAAAGPRESTREFFLLGSATAGLTLRFQPARRRRRLFSRAARGHLSKKLLTTTGKTIYLNYYVR